MTVMDLKCPGCGAPIISATAKCPYCGRLIEHKLSEEEKKQAEPPKQSLGAMIASKVTDGVKKIEDFFSGTNTSDKKNNTYSKENDFDEYYNNNSSRNNNYSYSYNYAKSDTDSSKTAEKTQSKNRYIAMFLCLFIFVQWFYLERTTRGILYLAFFLTGVPVFLAIVDFLIFATISDEKFERKYVRR